MNTDYKAPGNFSDIRRPNEEAENHRFRLPSWDGEGLPIAGAVGDVIEGTSDWEQYNRHWIGQRVTVLAVFKNRLNQHVIAVENSVGSCTTLMASLLMLPVRMDDQFETSAKDLFRLLNPITKWHKMSDEIKDRYRNAIKDGYGKKVSQ